MKLKPWAEILGTFCGKWEHLEGKKGGWLFHYNTCTKAKTVTFLSKYVLPLVVIQL